MVCYCSTDTEYVEISQAENCDMMVMVPNAAARGSLAVGRLKSSLIVQFSGCVSG